MKANSPSLGKGLHLCCTYQIGHSCNYLELKLISIPVASPPPALQSLFPELPIGSCISEGGWICVMLAEVKKNQSPSLTAPHHSATNPPPDFSISPSACAGHLLSRAFSLQILRGSAAETRRMTSKSPKQDVRLGEQRLLRLPVTSSHSILNLHSLTLLNSCSLSQP